MPSLAYYCRAGNCDRCQLSTPRAVPHGPSCTCGCHRQKELDMMDTIECEVCGRTLRAGPGASSHMRAMHPETLKTPVPPPSGSNGLRWEDPPTTSRGGKVLDRFRPFVAELERNPGRWARCVEYKGPTSAGAGATALRKAFPDLEIVGRRVEGGSAIFARYVEAD